MCFLWIILKYFTQAKEEAQNEKHQVFGRQTLLNTVTFRHNSHNMNNKIELIAYLKSTSITKCLCLERYSLCIL